MKKTVLYLFSLLLLFSSCIRENKNEAKDLQAGDILPQFSIEMHDGTLLKTDDLKGSISLVIFFNVVCPDCAQTLPEVQKIYETYAPKGVKVVAISRSQGEDMVGVYWQSREYTMPYSAQEDSKVYELFAQNKIPRVYISNENLVIDTVFTDEVFHRAAESEFIYNSMADVLDTLLDR